MLETARGLGAACLCAQLAGTCRGASSCSLEMPGGSGQGTLVTLQTVGPERFLTAVRTLKTVRRGGRGNWLRLFQCIKRGFFQDSFESHALLWEFFFLFSTYVNESGNFYVQQCEESYKWENLEPRQLQSAFPCFSRRRFLPWRRLPSISPHRDDGAGQGPLAPGRTPEARSVADNPPSLLFPYNALQRFLKTCAQLAGVSPGHPSCWWR